MNYRNNHRITPRAMPPLSEQSSWTLQSIIDGCSDPSNLSQLARLRRSVRDAIVGLHPDFTSTDIMVAVIRAQSSVRVAWKTEPSQTVNVRPDSHHLGRRRLSPIGLGRFQKVNLELDRQHFPVLRHHRQCRITAGNVDEFSADPLHAAGRAVALAVRWNQDAACISSRSDGLEAHAKRAHQTLQIEKLWRMR